MALMRNEKLCGSVGGLPRDMVIRTLGMKRVIEAESMANQRNGCHRGWHHADGSIKVIYMPGILLTHLDGQVLGDFKLGAKGGTWADKARSSTGRLALSRYVMTIFPTS